MSKDFVGRLIINNIESALHYLSDVFEVYLINVIIERNSVNRSLNKIISKCTNLPVFP
jgi:hypothetical protein